MKRALKIALAATMMATQVHADSMLERIKTMVDEKIHSSSISAGASLLNVSLNLDDALHLGTGLKYEYNLDPQSGQYLRQDKWSDNVNARVGYIAVADRRISRYMTYGRFFAQWRDALTSFVFSPLDLKNLNSEVLEERMHTGDMASITFDKATFLGLSVYGDGHGVSVGASAGKVFVGKVTTKILKRNDNKVTVSFANADESTYQLAGNVGISVIPGLLRIKLLSIDEHFHLRGTADLASYTYDLTNPEAKAALDKVLGAFDSPSILQDKALLQAGLELRTDLSDGIINVIPSEEASNRDGSGVVKEQRVTNNIVNGHRGKIKFSLLPGLLETSSEGLQSINLIDINLSGSFIKPGQYLVGYRSELDKQSSFGRNQRTQTITSVVYQPDPVLQNRDQGRGYRGLEDLVGISYHTESKKLSNVKELLTYAKLCNSGLLDCPAPIAVNVVPENSPAAARASNSSNVNSNYFFSKGLFQKIKERLNWATAENNAKRNAIRAAIAPMIHEFVLDKPDERTASLTSFFYEILDNNCYSNLIGLEAQNQKNIFKRIFSEKCGTELFEISDENIRHNMPALLIALYDPNLLPAATDLTSRASAESRAELAKYFAVSINTTYEGTEGVERQVNGKSFGMSSTDSNSPSAQVMEFTGLIDTWQQQTNNDLTFADKMKMLGQLGIQPIN